MSVCVLIPWRTSDCPYRTRALAWVLARHAENGWPVVIGHHDDGPWVKALAVSDALAQTNAETLVVADADVWADGLTEAVERVQDGTHWAVPHRGVHRLTERATGVLTATGERDVTDLAERAYLGVEGGGALVIQRNVYEACPIDPRFAGWGSEDEAHSMALRALYGPPHRSKQPLVHLWHPPQERATRRRGSLESWDLRKRYARAKDNPDAMRALIEEGRAHELDRPAEPLDDPCASLDVGRA
jgi:hypothetical protein